MSAAMQMLFDRSLKSHRVNCMASVYLQLPTHYKGLTHNSSSLSATAPESMQLHVLPYRCVGHFAKWG